MQEKIEVIRKAHLVDQLLGELGKERTIRDENLARQVQEIGKEWHETCHAISAHVVGVEAAIGIRKKRGRKRAPKEGNIPVAPDPEPPPEPARGPSGEEPPKNEEHSAAPGTGASSW